MTDCCSASGLRRCTAAAGAPSASISDGEMNAYVTASLNPIAPAARRTRRITISRGPWSRVGWRAGRTVGTKSYPRTLPTSSTRSASHATSGR